MRVNATGNVGIGTTAPAAPLHVRSTGQPDVIVEETTVGNAVQIALVNTTRSWELGSDSSPDQFTIHDATAGITRLSIDNNGNVGIGTTNPQNLLHIKGSGGINEVLIEEVFAGAAAQLTLKNPTRQWQIFADSSPDQFGIFDNNQNAARLVIDGNGNVGIGTTSPTNILTVKQNSNTDPIADAWTTYSSKRWKTNIKPIKGALDKVKGLRGVSYDWKADGKHDIGLIAEEVGEVIPEVVAYEDNGTDAKSVSYARLVAVLIEAVKAQQKQIDKQQKTMGGLSERITVLEKQSQKMASEQLSKIATTAER